MPYELEQLFLSTPSARRATVDVLMVEQPADISIHALREEGDEQAISLQLQELLFLSTPSARRATLRTYLQGGSRLTFLSTPSARRATRLMWFSQSSSSDFYPRPPRGGRPVLSM